MAQNPVGRPGDTMTLPAEIEESLCRCGGLARLVEQLPAEDLLNERSATLRALADPIRLKILAMLQVQPLCVCVIKALLGIADSKLSYHLSVLKKAGLIVGDQQGNWIIYRLTEQGVGWTANVLGDRPGGTHS
ncbi:ArsR family transcriptional regulator [Methanoculleus taiwanensis]|uniref:ArsR family transcriptional regulator n=1 Tax=Methanoculleus taiwanensis TaxID=1550565 RepID=A0A498H1W3_9EURY|nr:metalloregulator ArsR/SmtB family transcription factor [Methanoculleus taiwanensis]RXE56832.1 ArsR family transcriptional regulator [Methanoculleus taiwanensis]